MTRDSTPDVGPGVRDGAGESVRRSDHGRSEPVRSDSALPSRDDALEAGRRTLESAKRGLWRALARPTAGDAATAALTLLVGVLVGSTLVGLEVAALALGAGLAAALVTALFGSASPLGRGLGGALAVPVAILVASPALLAGALALTSSGVGALAGLVVWALVVAGLAAGLVSWEPFGRGGVRRGAAGTMLAACGVAAVVVLRVVPESSVRDRAGAAAVDVLGIAGDALVAANGSWASVTFPGLVLVAAFASSRTLGYLPLERLVPPDRRGTLADGVARGRRACSLAIRAALALAVAAFAAASVLGGIESTPVTPAELRTGVPAPAGDALAWLVTASGLRLALVALALLALSLATLEWTRRALGRNVAGVVARLAAPAVGGALVALVLARALSGLVLEDVLERALSGSAPSSVVDLVGALPAFALAATALVFALGSLASVLWSVTALRTVRVLPARAGGAALAAGAVFLLAIGLAVAGRVEPAILTATGAFVCWDIGEYADGVRTELGREAPTLRAELVHVGGSVLTGAVVAGGTVTCYRWVATEASFADPAHAAAAVGTGLLAVVLVAWSLRG